MMAKKHRGAGTKFVTSQFFATTEDKDKFYSPLYLAQNNLHYGKKIMHGYYLECRYILMAIYSYTYAPHSLIYVRN